MVSNEIGTTQHIPATSLRGALAAALQRDGRTSDLPKWFGNVHPRWMPAWPVDGERVLAPMPLAFVHEKGDEGFSGLYGVINRLYHFKDLPLSLKEYRKKFCCTEPEGDHRFQWTSFHQPWLVPKVGLSLLRAVDRQPASDMHVALNYARQSHRKSALYSRSTIAPKTSFVSWVLDPGNLCIDATHPPTEIFFGKRRSAGNGAATISWSDEAPPWAKPGGTGGGDNKEAVFQLMTDAIVAGPNGGYLRGLDEETLSALLGVSIKLEAAVSSWRDIFGWSGAWGLPREQAAGIAAGSAWRLRLDNQDDAKFTKALERISKEGIGIRRNEGFGWVAVNPSWLLDSGIMERSNTPEAQFKPKHGANWWPDLPLEHPSILRNLNQQAKNLVAALPRDTREQRLETLAAYAGRANNKKDVRNFLKMMGNRVNARGWEKVMEAALGPLDDCANLDQVRFLLEAAVVYATPVKKKG